MGAACRWWLDKSLALLGERIAAKGGKLILRRGAAEAVIAGLVEETGAEAVYWNRRYGAARKIDERIKAALKGDGVAVESFNGALLAEPFALKTGAGGDFKVFTPFWKALQASLVMPAAAPEPRALKTVSGVASDDAGGLGAASERSPTGRAAWRGVDAGRDGRAQAAARFPEGRDRGLLRRTRPAGPGRHVAPVALSALRRDQPAPVLARGASCGGSGRGAGARRAEISLRDRVARFLVSPALPRSADAEAELAAAVRRGRVAQGDQGRA